MMLTRGLWWPELQRRMVVDDGRSAETGRLLVGRRLQTGAGVLDGSDHFRGLVRRWRGG
jgi:hypothetical protein